MIRYLVVLALFSAASVAEAAVFTVGAGGTHATIQGAIDAALAAGGSNSIRVASGTFNERLSFTPSGPASQLDISGGWTSNFTTQSNTKTTVDAGSLGRVLNVNARDGDSLMLNNLRFINGLASPAAGILVNQIGSSSVVINQCEISNNTAEADRAEAAGMRVSVSGDSSFELSESLVSNNNSVCSGDIDCREGGIGLQAADSAQVTISGNTITDNSVSIGSGSAFTGGAQLYSYGSSLIIFEDNVVTDNSVSGSGSSGIGAGVGLIGDGTITARRNWIAFNNTNVPAVPNNFPQFFVANWGSNTWVVSDTVVAKGNGRGFGVQTSGAGTPTIHVTNLTIVGHPTLGMLAERAAMGGALNISNTLCVINTNNISFVGSIGSTTNLFAGSGVLTNYANNDFSLDVGSPAINAGTNSPPGGLGPTDINGTGRISGGIVDIGAYEKFSQTVFEDGFETP
jgi:hypothetical protein